MKRNVFIKIGMLIGICTVSAMVISFNSIQEYYNPPIQTETRSWRQVELYVLGDYGAADTSGVNSSFIWAHQNDPNIVYNANLSNSSANCYAHTETNNTHAGSNVPYSTAFNIIVTVRWNVTHAWNGTAFDSTYTRGYINCSGLSVAATGVKMNQTLIGSDTTYVWYNYYVQDADGGTGTGFTLTKGQNVTSCSFVFEAYY